MIIEARGSHFQVLNEAIRCCTDSYIELRNVNGQRYIGDALSGREVEIYGTPGNALGAYLDGAQILVHGNAQDATGDTMNDGMITICGRAGDATGYGMRGGMILVKEDIGYRAGIHMKEYEDKKPVIIVGGCAGSFLGEYQAGGVLVILGIGKKKEMPVGNFCGSGMHGGRIILQCESVRGLPAQVEARRAALEEVLPYIRMYCAAFGDEYFEKLCEKPYMVLTPNTKNPYKQLYTYM